MGAAGRACLAAAPAVSAVSAAIAASVTMAGAPQRRIAAVDRAVVDRFTMPFPVEMLVRALRRSGVRSATARGNHRHVAVAILSYTTAGAGGRVAWSSFRFVMHFRLLKHAGVSIFALSFCNDFRAGKIAARRIPFIRVCQPSPVDLNAFKTSASTRRLMASFLVSDFGRPLGRIPIDTVAPAICASVNSGASSYSSRWMTWASTFFKSLRIACLLLVIAFSHRHHMHGFAARSAPFMQQPIAAPLHRLELVSLIAPQDAFRLQRWLCSLL